MHFFICVCVRETGICRQSRSSTWITSEAHIGLNKRRHDQNWLVTNSINVIDPSIPIKHVSKYHVSNARLTLWKRAGVASLGWRGTLGQHKQDVLTGALAADCFAVLAQLQKDMEFRLWLPQWSHTGGSGSSCLGFGPPGWGAWVTWGPLDVADGWVCMFLFWNHSDRQMFDYRSKTLTFAISSESWQIKMTRYKNKKVITSETFIKHFIFILSLALSHTHRNPHTFPVAHATSAIKALAVIHVPISTR